MNQIHVDPSTGFIIFGWKEIEYSKVNGALIGYEVKLYYDEEVYTDKVVKSVNTYTISPQRLPSNATLLPNAISVAAVNELGVGNHSPPVKVILSG